VREPEALGLELDVAYQEQIEVQRPGTVSLAAKHPPLLHLDCLA
jgi:hypothetical protein